MRIYLKSSFLVSIFDPLSNLVYSSNGQDVRTVIIDGEIIMEDKVVNTLKENDILNQVSQRVERLYNL